MRASPFSFDTSTISEDSPLHVSKFFEVKKRAHKNKIAARQNLIVWLVHTYLSTFTIGYGYDPRPKVRLLSLREIDRDYRQVLDKFFVVEQTGFCFREENDKVERYDISTLKAIKLPAQYVSELQAAVNRLEYKPPVKPEGVESKVVITKNLNGDDLIMRAKAEGKAYLIPQIKYLISKPEHTFVFKPSGRLQLRDTSVYPVRAIETWPSWLREELFGCGIDIDAAYTQYLLEYLTVCFESEEKVHALYPQLVQLLHDKEAIRKDLCENYFHSEYNPKNKMHMKKILMSIANGSKISDKMLVRNIKWSQTVDYINNHFDINTEDKKKIGIRLQSIASEYRQAKTDIANINYGGASKKANKQVFLDYFDWERSVRYLIWERAGKQGIMVHDSIEGIPEDLIEPIRQSMNIMLSK
jgi:hypothetical protein